MIKQSIVWTTCKAKIHMYVCFLFTFLLAATPLEISKGGGGGGESILSNFQI